MKSELLLFIWIILSYGLNYFFPGLFLFILIPIIFLYIFLQDNNRGYVVSFLAGLLIDILSFNYLGEFAFIFLISTFISNSFSKIFKKEGVFSFLILFAIFSAVFVGLYYLSKLL